MSRLLPCHIMSKLGAIINNFHAKTTLIAIEKLCELFCRGQPKLLHQLLHSARMAKVQLSTLTETVVHMPSSSNPRAQRGPTLNISRTEMEGMTQRLRSKLSPPLEKLGKECFVEWVGECVFPYEHSKCRILVICIL